MEEPILPPFQHPFGKPFQAQHSPLFVDEVEHLLNKRTAKRCKGNSTCNSSQTSSDVSRPVNTNLKASLAFNTIVETQRPEMGCHQDSLGKDNKEKLVCARIDANNTSVSTAKPNQCTNELRGYTQREDEF